MKSDESVQEAMPPVLTYDRIELWLQDLGANVTGAVPAAAWAEYLPAACRAPDSGAAVPAADGRSILLFGAGGPELLHRYYAHAAVHGEYEHFLTDYAHQHFLAHFGGDSPRYLHPYRSGLRFPFQRAMVAAGLGVLGLNHVVLHPDWGPWFAPLGALVLDDVPPLPAPAAFDPCTGCAAPCLQACPSGAVSRAGFDGETCIATKLSHGPCLHACLARNACVVRADLRREMLALEGRRRRDDAETRALLRSFLGARGTGQ